MSCFSRPEPACGITRRFSERDSAERVGDPDDSNKLSRLGEINKVRADDALFLKQFGGKILTEFERLAYLT